MQAPTHVTQIKYPHAMYNTTTESTTSPFSSHFTQPQHSSPRPRVKICSIHSKDCQSPVRRQNLVTESIKYNFKVNCQQTAQSIMFCDLSI